MFPTPPSHEHPSIASPADTLDHDGFSVHVPSHVKQELRSPMTGYGEDLHDDELSIMLTSSKFAPLSRLYSDTTRNRRAHGLYLEAVVTQGPARSLLRQPIHDAFLSSSGWRSHYSGQRARALLRDYSPGHAQWLVQARPLAHIARHVPRRPQESHRPGLRGTPPAWELPSQCDLLHCPSSIRKFSYGESLLYLPEFAEGKDHDCKCGCSGVINRKLGHLSGMFLEDQLEVTGLQLFENIVETFSFDHEPLYDIFIRTLKLKNLTYVQ